MPRTARVVAGVAAATLGAAVTVAPAWGAAWVDPAVVGSLSSDTPYVAGSAGSAVAAWTRETNPIEGDSELYISARGPGQGPAMGSVVSGTEPVGEPSLAANDNGTIAVAWTSNPSDELSQVNLRVYRNGALVGSDVVVPAEAGDEADDAEVAVAPDGSVLLAWVAGAAPRTVRAKVRRPDGSLTGWFPLSSSGDAFDLDAAADGTGFITTFIREDGSTNTVEVVRAPLAGGSSTPVTLATGDIDIDAFSSPVVAAGGGRAVVAYAHDHDGTTLKVRGAIGTVAGGVGMVATDFSGTHVEAEQPTVAAGPNGTLAVAYADGAGSGTTNLAVAAPGQGFAAPETLRGPASRYDLGVLPDGSVLAGVATNRLEGVLRDPAGTITSKQFADPGAITGGTVAGDGAGHVVAAFATPPAGSVFLTAFDAAPPRAGTLDVPERGRVGERLTFRSLGARDDWSGLAEPEWTFGDGGRADGTSVSHTYQRAGRFGLGLTLADTAGNSAVSNAGTVVVSAEDGTPPPPGPVIGAPVTQSTASTAPAAGDRTAPILGRLVLSRSVFRVASGATAFAAGRRIRVGAQARFRTLEPGLVRVVIARMADVPSLRSRCAAAGLPMRSKRGSVRRVKFERMLGAGTHRIRLTGRAGRKALPRGRYELRVSVADESGNRSRAQVARFTLC